MQTFDMNMESLKQTGKAVGLEIGKENSREVENRAHLLAAGKGMQAAKMINNKVYHYR